MKKKIISFLLAVLMLCSFVTVSAQDEALHPDETVAKEYSDVFLKTLVRNYAHDLADNYYYGISDAQLLYSALCSTIEEGKFDINKVIEKMISALEDEHADYYTQEEITSLMQDYKGEFSGIGVVMTMNEKGLFITSVMEDSAAQKAGVKEGDYIVAVNGTSVIGMQISDARNLVVGPDGTEVKVTVIRGEETLDFTCVRSKVSVSNIETDMVEEDIAYLKIVQFAQNTPDEIAEYVKELQQKSVKKLVIDLRNNPGGDIDAAISIANIFISAGQIGEFRYRNEKNNTTIKSTNYNAPRLKIVVLVNGGSASASEFLAMAFQGRGAGKIMGTKTYGKGSMQIVKTLPVGGGMKYTIGEFYTTKGQRVHTVGITPDIIVENTLISVEEEKFVKIDYNRMDEAGKNGEMNLALEQRLYAVGLLAEEADDVFDEKTAEAVKNLQLTLGYEVTGVPGFYEYLYLNDFDYDFDIEVDNQLNSAIDYLKK